MTARYDLLLSIDLSLLMNLYECAVISVLSASHPTVFVSNSNCGQ